MNKEISCNNFIGLLGFLRRHYGDDGVRQVIKGLVDNDQYLIADKDEPSKVMTVQEHHLNDSAYWVSNAFSLALFANVKKVVPGKDPLFTAGEGAVTERLSKSILFIGRIFGPKLLSKQVPKLNARFNKTKDVILADLTEYSSTFEFHYYPNFRVTKDICNWNRGIYSSSAKLSGATNVTCQEIKCVVDGDECCAFKLNWNKPGLTKQIIQRFMKSGIKDLIADYELTIKDRDQLIERLSRSEKRFRDLVENINELIYAVDLYGTITYVSPAVKHLGGYDPSEIVGKNFLDLVYEEDLPVVMKRFQEILDLKRLEPVDFRVIEKSGGLRWVNTSSKLVFETDTDVGLQAVMSDLTALKTSEKEKK
ncbi:MAG: PAS domain S-box protein, partial [Deltaproteobacteria bacterium]|nr:PAS domain S-box protein [Deltaproteobacteria bacterium]